MYQKYFANTKKKPYNIFERTEFIEIYNKFEPI